MVDISKKQILAKTGYKGIEVERFDFFGSKTPSSWIPKILYDGRLLHKTSPKPLGGSLLLYARKFS
jgi:hypothetical protein